jgi:hypothetical protein
VPSLKSGGFVAFEVLFLPPQPTPLSWPAGVRAMTGFVLEKIEMHKL